MDSRIEVIEKLEEAKRRAEGVHGYSAIDKIDEAISLLTAVPEPCEDYRKAFERWAIESGYSIDGTPLYADYDTRRNWQGWEAAQQYVSLREQDAREDERRWCAERAINYLRVHRFDEDDGVGLCAAILQGTKPAKVSEDVGTALECLKMSVAAIDDELDRSIVQKDYDRLVARLKEGR